jgi:hypothetical protein
LTMAAAGAFRQLLSLPTLRYVKTYTAKIELPVFLSLWESCSPSIRHLHLSCSTTSDDPSHLIGGHPSSRIPLKSLRLGPSNNINIYNWLSHDLCPFDVALLTVLSIGGYTSIFDWRAMAPALRTLKILQFTVLICIYLYLLTHASLKPLQTQRRTPNRSISLHFLISPSSVSISIRPTVNSWHTTPLRQSRLPLTSVGSSCTLCFRLSLASMRPRWIPHWHVSTCSIHSPWSSRWVAISMSAGYHASRN